MEGCAGIVRESRQRWGEALDEIHVVPRALANFQGHLQCQVEVRTRIGDGEQLVIEQVKSLHQGGSPPRGALFEVESIAPIQSRMRRLADPRLPGAEGGENRLVGSLSQSSA